jgi:hypothetical protein
MKSIGLGIVLGTLVTQLSSAQVKDNFELAKPVFAEVKLQKNGSWLNISQVTCKAVGTSDEEFGGKTQCFPKYKTCGIKLLLKQLKYRCSAVIVKDEQPIDLGTIIPTDSGFEFVQNDKAPDELVKFGKSKIVESHAYSSVKSSCTTSKMHKWTFHLCIHSLHSESIDRHRVGGFL